MHTGTSFLAFLDVARAGDPKAPCVLCGVGTVGEILVSWGIEGAAHVLLPPEVALGDDHWPSYRAVQPCQLMPGGSLLPK